MKFSVINLVVIKISRVTKMLEGQQNCLTHIFLDKHLGGHKNVGDSKRLLDKKKFGHKCLGIVGQLD